MVTTAEGSASGLPREHSIDAQEEEERRVAAGGDALAASKTHEKALEKKEAQLRGLIDLNYGRIREVEKELAGLQLQLKLTSGPKRGALELLRRKIEAQNEKVAMARRNYARARKIADAAHETLAAEERVKDQLCQELNLLIQESAHAQLEKLDQLTRRLELLNRDLTVTESDLTAEGSPVGLRLAQQPSPSPRASPTPVAAPAAEAGTSGGTAPQAATAAAAVDTGAAAAAAAQKKAQEAAARQAAASAARAKHVQLPTSRPAAPARGAAPRQAPPPPQQPAGGGGAFRGFDA